MQIPSSPVGQTNKATGRVAQTQAPAAPQDFIAPALSNLANSINRTGDFFFQRQQQTENLSWLSNFNEFKHSQEMRLVEAGRDAIPGQPFSDGFLKDYSSAEEEFLKGVPERLRDDFGLKTQALHQGLVKGAVAHEFTLQDQYSRDRVGKEFEISLSNLVGNTSPEALERERFRMREVFDNTSLSAAEKLSLQREYERGIEQAVYSNAIAASVEQSNAEGPGTAARLGAGEIVSELLTYENVPEFTKIMTDVERKDYVQGRLEVIEAGLTAELGTWDELPTAVKEIALAMAFVTGDIPEAVMDELEAGDVVGFQLALEAMEGDYAFADYLTSSLEDDLLQTGAFANIPFETRQAIKADAEKDFAIGWKAEKALLEKQRLSQVNTLMVAIQDGQAGEVELEALREKGVITSYTEIKAAEGAIESFKKKNGDSISGYNRLLEGNPWPDNTDNRKQLDAMLEPGLAALGEADYGFAMETLVPVIAKTQLLPPEVINTLESMSRGGDVEKRMYAFEVLDQMKRVAPEAFASQTNDALDRNVQFYADRKDLYTPEELMKKMTMDPEQSTLRAQMHKDAQKVWTNGNNSASGENTINLVLDGMKSGGFMGIGQTVPTMPVNTAQKAAMEKDALVIFQEEYARDGDSERAQKATVNSLAKLWGRSEVGGSSVVMRYPPEQSGYTKLGGNYDWIEKQARTELKIPPKANFQLISDAQTRQEALVYSAEAGELPSYRVVWFSEEHGPQISSVRWHGDQSGFEEINTLEFNYLSAREKASTAVDDYHKYSANARNGAPADVIAAKDSAVALERAAKEAYDNALKATQ